MPSSEKMLRVSKANPCPVCSKPDWCLVTEDGSAAICARIEQGSVKKCGDAGYLHILESRHKRHKSSVNKRRIRKSICAVKNQTNNFAQLAQQYQQQLTAKNLNTLATPLGVSAQSLKRLNIGWDGEAYTFPMSNAEGKIIGIRRRFPNGNKVSLKGSKMGLFIPSDLATDGLLLICEGPTDTAAALDLDFAAIGRPNCNSKIEMTAKVARGRTEIVIIGDSDKQGRAGAEKLAARLVLCCPNVRVIYPPDPTKDLRKWLNSGLTANNLQEVIDKAEPIKIKVRLIRKSLTARRLQDEQM